MIHKFKLVICFILVLISLLGCSNTNKQDAIILFMSNSHIDTYPTSIALEIFAENINKRTNGRIIVEVYNKSLLGNEASVTAQIQAGGIDLARISLPILAKFESSLNALQLPYLYRDEPHMWSVLNGEIGNKFLNSESMQEKGILGLAWYTGGSRNFYNSKKEISKPSDLSGLKIRVQESRLMMGMVEAMGGIPVPVASADVYSAIESGIVDGAENSFTIYVSDKHHEIAKYITVDEHTRVPEMIVASKKTMDRLSKEDQQIIRECALESSDKELELWKAYEDKSIKTAVDSGCIITVLNESQIAEFKKSVESLNKIEGEPYKDILDDIAATK